MTSNILETASHLIADDAGERRSAIDPSPLAAATTSADSSKREHSKQSLRTVDPAQVRALRVNDAVTSYGLSRSTLYKLMAAGVLRSVRVGGRRLIPRDAMEKLIAGGGQ